jgi:hypothetical protein
MQSLETDPEDVRNAWLLVLAAEASTHVERDLKIAATLEDYSAALRRHKLRLLDCTNIEARARKLRADFYREQLLADNSSQFQVELALQTAKKQAAAGTPRKEQPDPPVWLDPEELLFKKLSESIEPKLNKVKIPYFRHKSSVAAFIAVLVFMLCAATNKLTLGFWVLGGAIASVFCGALLKSNRKS